MEHPVAVLPLACEKAKMVATRRPSKVVAVRLVACTDAVGRVVSWLIFGGLRCR